MQVRLFSHVKFKAMDVSLKEYDKETNPIDIHDTRLTNGFVTIKNGFLFVNIFSTKFSTANSKKLFSTLGFCSWHKSIRFRVKSITSIRRDFQQCTIFLKLVQLIACIPKSSNSKLQFNRLWNNAKNDWKFLIYIY